MPLPWSAEMPDLMRDALGDNWMLYLPFLWFAGPETDLLRRPCSLCLYGHCDPR